MEFMSEAKKITSCSKTRDLTRKIMALSSDNGFFEAVGKRAPVDYCVENDSNRRKSDQTRTFGSMWRSLPCKLLVMGHILDNNISIIVGKHGKQTIWLVLENRRISQFNMLDAPLVKPTRFSFSTLTTSF
jgi:hypothetical protein